MRDHGVKYGCKKEVAECSDTIEQRMNSGGSNDEKLTDVEPLIVIAFDS